MADDAGRGRLHAAGRSVSPVPDGGPVRLHADPLQGPDGGSVPGRSGRDLRADPRQRHPVRHALRIDHLPGRDPRARRAGPPIPPRRTARREQHPDSDVVARRPTASPKPRRGKRPRRRGLVEAVKIVRGQSSALATYADWRHPLRYRPTGPADPGWNARGADGTAVVRFGDFAHPQIWRFGSALSLQGKADPDSIKVLT